MKRILKVYGAAVAALFLCLGRSVADSGRIVVDGYMPVPAVAAYSSTFSVRTDGLNRASAQIVVTSVTQVSPTFNDGRASTGSFTVVSFTALSTTTATGTNITISSDTALVGACLSGGGGPGTVGSFNVCNPQNFAVTGTTATDCSAISSAINAFNIIVTTCAGSPGNVITSTAPFPGTAWNSFIVNSSTIAAISSATFSGGQDNQYLMIGSRRLLANTDFFPITSVGVTAAAIATAWNATAGSQTVTLAAAGAVIGTTATFVGPSGNFALVSSSNAALSVSALVSSTTVGVSLGSMTGGNASSYTINGSVINIPGQNLGLAQGIWFSQTTGNSGLSPLAVGTTYFAMPNGNSVQLSLTSTGAVAGLPIVFTSSQVKTTSDVFQLNVQAPATPASSSVQWVASNDNLHWLPYNTTPNNITIPSVTYATYLATGSVNNFDFGQMDFSYLGLSVTASTGAPTNILAHIIGKE